MIAYLPDGTIMSYDDYIHSEYWRSKKVERSKIDNDTCCICHKKINYPVHHHIDYERLGHENIMTDIVTLCNSCHTRFHNTWGTITGIVSQKTKEHWSYYSPQTTLSFFIDYQEHDILLGGKLKMTEAKTIRECIEEYYKVHDTNPVRSGLISEEDVQAFFKNRRLDLLIREIGRKGIEYQQFLTDHYGEPGKPGQGPNEVRNFAHKFFGDMAKNNCIKARGILYGPQYRYIENLWDQYLITLIKTKEETNNAETK